MVPPRHPARKPARRDRTALEGDDSLAREPPEGEPLKRGSGEWRAAQHRDGLGASGGAAIAASRPHFRAFRRRNWAGSRSRLSSQMDSRLSAGAELSAELSAPRALAMSISRRIHAAERSAQRPAVNIGDWGLGLGWRSLVGGFAVVTGHG